jgi:hypothetical protein
MRHGLLLSVFFLFLGGPALAGDSPQISRSVGEPGGVVVLWPRVIPATDTPATRHAAALVQAQLRKLVAETLAGRPVDTRPEPERVCPQAGCKAMTVGALLIHSGDACAVVALISGPGRAPATLVPWAGRVDLKRVSIGFREPAESYVTIRDFQHCSALVEPLKAGEAVVKQAIVSASRAAAVTP